MKPLKLELIGIWIDNNDEKLDVNTLPHSSDDGSLIRIKKNQSCFEVTYLQNKYLSIDHCLILYDEDFISKNSFHLSFQFKLFFCENWSKSSPLPLSSHENIRKSNDLISFENHLSSLGEHIPHLYVVIASLLKFSKSSLRNTTKSPNLQLSFLRLELKGFLFITVSCLLTLLGLIFSEMIKLFIFMLKPVQWLGFLNKRLAKTSAIWKNLLGKYNLLTQLNCKSTIRGPNESTIKAKNITMVLMCDAGFGLLIFWLLLTFEVGHMRTVAKELVPYIELIAQQVDDLVRWLMGVPIGLKLNLPLNKFLGNFFLHHVRLWLEYLRTGLEGISSSVSLQRLTLMVLSLTCLGFTFLLAAASDVLSLLTFHVYCFYIYAARLFQIQLAGMISLSRLFRGKKWNPLRARVDTLPDGGEFRFFTGTLFFAILCFLFPTMALYYAIFTALRVAILCVQVTLDDLRELIARAPLFTVCASLLFPLSSLERVDFVWGERELERRRASWDGEELDVLSDTVRLRLLPKRWLDVWTENLLQVEPWPSESSRPSSIAKLISCIVSGEIIKS